MKKIIYIITVLFASLSLGSCHDWLTEQAPGKTDIKDFFTSGEAATQCVNAAYVPMQWQFGTTYFPEWFIGDICSDDAVKGGENLQNQETLYDMCNFKTTSGNESLLLFYRSQFQGVGRANLAIEQISKMELDETLDERLRDRLIGEAEFLRAFYYFRLVRVFGGVPRIEAPIYSSNDWRQPRASAEAIYELIFSDLADAEKKLWLKSEYPNEDLGRATKGAAQAMLLKTHLQNHDYDEARNWGAKFIEEQSAEYDLCTDFMDNFYFEGENGIESVFEIQYMVEGTSDWGGDIPGGGLGATRGNLDALLTRPRSLLLLGNGSTIGYGFNKPSVDLCKEFGKEHSGDPTGDPRFEYTVVIPADDQITTPAQEIHYGNRNISRKYLYELKDGTFPQIDNSVRCPLNHKEIRLADVLLMYAEACIESNTDLDKAATQLNRVRTRAGLGSVEATRENLRHERRLELAMEGHRWFDLCRWGIVGETMRAYKNNYQDEERDGSSEGTDMYDFVDGKHELFPIPWEEVSLGGLTQNPGY